jgi:hypothetical protein
MDSIQKKVDRLFGELPTPHGRQCQNPITGGWFLGGIDPIEDQKQLARQALLARRWCAKTAPPDLPPLPLHTDDIFNMKIGWGLLHLYGFYARSIACQRYIVRGHPTFDEFARGMLAAPFAPDFFKENEELRKRFPPRPLPGLAPGNIWLPPKEYAERMASYRYTQARLAREAAARAAVDRNLAAAA